MKIQRGTFPGLFPYFSTLFFSFHFLRSPPFFLLPCYFFFLFSSFHILCSLSGFVRSHIKKPRLRDYNRVATALRGDTRVALANVAYAESCTRHVRRMRNGEK